MPMRFNQQELISTALKNKDEFDKEGILSLREIEDKIFHKTDSMLLF